MIKNVIEYLQHSAQKHPNKILFEDEKQALTFAQVDYKARQIATVIKQTLGLHEKNQPICIYIEKSVDCLVAFLGVAYSGNYYCPIDTKMPDERRNMILQILNPELVICLNESFDEFPDRKKIFLEKAYKSVIDEDLCASYKNVLDIDPLYVLFTSGSTGVPKGVVISHRGVIDYTEWLHETFMFDQNNIFGNQAPFYFDNSILDIYSSIKNGATLVIIPEKLFVFPAKLFAYLNEKKINTIFWVPSALVSVANSGVLEEYRINELKKVLFCGEVMPTKQLNIWRKHYPDIMYVNLYGPTEITDVCTYYVVEREFADDEVLPIGKACHNTEVLVLNDKNDRAEINQEGELCVRGCGVALGYYANWDKTSEVFVQNPLNSCYRDIIYRTGDIVYINERAEIIYVGRKDFQIKHQGHRIELGEIESSLGAMRDVQQSCAIYDEANKKIILFCVLVADKQTTEKQIYAFLKCRIPKYMLPAQIVLLDEFPLNINGKINRLELKKLWSKNEAE